MARVFGDTPIYAVGGSVRNERMGLPASDVDVCGPARPEEVLRLCEGTEVHAVLRAAHFGTVELHARDDEGRHMAEYTTFRVDSYRCGHQPEQVRFADSLDVDALRRDFSVNALYQPLTGGEVIDPTGGLAHLQEGVLHTVTADPDQVLKDDGLRILRAARFQAELGLAPTDALIASAKKHSPLLRDIARERLHDELHKILLADLRYPALARSVHPVQAGLETLARVNAWEALFGDLALDEEALTAQARYTAPQGVAPASGRMALLFGRQTPDALLDAMRRLCFSVRESEEAARLLLAQRGGDAFSAFDAAKAGKGAMRHVAAAREALGLPTERARELLSALGRVPGSLRELAVNGDDLLALCRELSAPPRRIGEALNALWRETALEALPNERAALLARARALLAG
ncbi:MAG: hypothetical protein PHY12_05285 [Eubacteriales bacterium]|nr:hypothetical protein [Eubacteriales bacterium]